MQKRTPAAQTLSLQITEGEKFELLVTQMSGGGNPQNMKFINAFCYRFSKHATAFQRESFIKLYDMGWELGKIVWDEAVGKIAFSVRADGCAAWVGPDGALQRSQVGKKTAYLDKNWKELP